MPRITIPTAGLSKLAASIVGGQGAYDQGMEEGVNAQSKISQALASMRASEASADLNFAKADAERDALARQTPEALQQTAMTRFGVPSDERGAVDSFLKSGNLGGKYAPVPDELGGGPVAPQPDWAKNLGGIAQSIAGMQEALTLGDKNVENVAKAEGVRRNSRLSDAILAGTMERNKVGGAQAAVEGKALFNSNEYGSMDNFTGQVDDTSGPAQRFAQHRQAGTKKELEQAGAARANAAESYAGVGLKNAQTKKALLEVQQVMSGEKGKMTSPEDKFKAEDKLRDEFTKQSQTFVKTRDAFGKLQAAAQSPNAASDIALIFAYMKMLDPDSVVREGEFATAQNAAGLPDQVVNMYNRALDGTRLNAVQRRNLLGEGRKVYQVQEAGLHETKKTFTDMSERYGLDVRNVVRDFASPTPSTTAISSTTPAAQAASFGDAEKERRYQEWKKGKEK